MARRKGRGWWIFYFLILGGLVWLGFKYYYEVYSFRNYLKPAKSLRVLESDKELAANFPLKNIREKELDLNRDGRKEILLTSLDDSGPRAVLVDAENTDKKLSEVFDFATAEEEFKSDQAPEPRETADLNGDGVEEIVLDLKDYGAYTDSYGVLAFNSGKLEWVMLREADGSGRPAIFRDGSSVKHANIFKILEEGGKKALVQIFGEEDEDENWSWQAEAFSWNGSEYAYAAALSQKILKEQPKRFENGEPVF